jgi:hypothetical protein
MTRQRAVIAACAVGGGSLARVIVGSPPWALTLIVACVIGAALGQTTVAHGPVTEVRDAADWWEPSVPAPRLPKPQIQPTSPRLARPLESYLKSTRPDRIPQCPGCAGFDIDVPRPGATGFVCRTCGDEWHWTHGDPWPPVTLQPLSPTSIHH